MKWTPTDDKQDYGTPWWLYRLADRMFGPFTMDAAAHAGNAKHPNYLTEADDALSILWSGKAWLNPPYARGTMKRWLPHAYRSARSAPRGECVVCLIPVRPGSKWWSQHVHGVANEVWFIPFRVKFIGGEGGARFDACLVVYRDHSPLDGKTHYDMLPVTEADLADDDPPVDVDVDFLSRRRYPWEQSA